MKDRTGLLEAQSQWVQGIYLRLSTQAELGDDKPYKVHLIVAVRAASTKDPAWAKKKPHVADMRE
ncbi:MAG: hypothetical protein OZ922_02825 [Myxococcales bacterium]|jgi:hypothetical protein|nr:hypothetical protein [Myxococcales bacterium]